MEKSKIEVNLNEYDNYDRVVISFNDGEAANYDDIAEFSWNAAKDIAELVNSVGTIIYINMYSVTIMSRYRCGGKPYTVN